MGINIDVASIGRGKQKTRTAFDSTLFKADSLQTGWGPTIGGGSAFRGRHIVIDAKIIWERPIMCQDIVVNNHHATSLSLTF